MLIPQSESWIRNLSFLFLSHSSSSTCLYFSFSFSPPKEENPICSFLFKCEDPHTAPSHLGSLCLFFLLPDSKQENWSASSSTVLTLPALLSLLREPDISFFLSLSPRFPLTFLGTVWSFYSVFVVLVLSTLWINANSCLWFLMLQKQNSRDQAALSV